jgi:hypothetical protein
MNLQFPSAFTHNHLIPVLYHALASLVYHETFLKNTLPENHPLFSTHLFSTGILDTEDLVAEMKIGDFETSVLTGIPPHVSQLIYLNNVLKNSDPERVISAIKAFLEKRELQPSSTVTILSLQQTLASFKDELLDAIQDHRAQAPSIAQTYDSVSTYWTLSSTGKYSRVPDTFQLPTKCRLETAWRLWFLGNPSKRVTSLCKVEASDLQSRQQRKTLSEWRVVIKHLMEQLKSKGEDGLESMTTTEDGVVQLYKNLFKLQIIRSTRKGKKTSRICQKSILSIAKEIRKHTI